MCLLYLFLIITERTETKREEGAPKKQNDKRKIVLIYKYNRNERIIFGILFIEWIMIIIINQAKPKSVKLIRNNNNNKEIKPNGK